jgi:hypothetical protein
MMRILTAAERKKQAEASKDAVQARAAGFYEKQRERNEKSFSGLEARSTFTVGTVFLY